MSYADRNIRSFLLFRVLFNARFYYPVLAVLFLDLGLSLEQYALLNVAWAAAIVVFEVPSGALADLIGRKKLVVAASILMVVEMCIFAFAPTRNTQLLFWLFILNRIFSGAAEACASGADEALVYDSLKSESRESEWPAVLERLNKLSAICFFVAMIVGSLVYDPATFNVIGGWFGWHWNLQAADVVRFPIYLTLVASVFTCFATLAMHESPIAAHQKVTLREAFRNVVWSGRWIWHSPVAFFVMFATLANDCFLRLVMTLTSKYFRLIHLPEMSFGLIGAALGLLNYLSPLIAKRFIALGSAQRAFAMVSVITTIGLMGLPFAFPYVGLGFVALIGLAMGILMFLTSYYLNEVAEPAKRATILSFKGLTSNLAYGGIGIFFAALLKNLQHAHSNSAADGVFLQGLQWLPWTFLVVIGLTYGTSKIRRLSAASPS